MPESLGLPQTLFRSMNLAFSSQVRNDWVGQSRTALGCGNPFKPTCALWRTKIPYAFAVGEPATMSRPLKLKVQEPRGLTVFQLPDHGFTRAVCGGVPQMFLP